MSNINYIDESDLHLERPNLRMECNILNDEQMNNYLIIYNTYNTLLISYLMEEYDLKRADDELIKHNDLFTPIKEEDMDLYQKSSNGFLQYFYLRNNLHVERFSKEEIQYLYHLYQTKDTILDLEKKSFVKNTFKKIILEEPNIQNHQINYGPDNGKYFKPSNAIIIGVRYEQFKDLETSEEVFETFADKEGKLQILIDYLMYRIRNKKDDIPFFVIKYDEFGVKTKKKINNSNKR